MNNSIPFSLTDREKALEPLAVALASGFRTAARDAVQRTADAACVRIEETSWNRLRVATAYCFRSRFDAGISGQALLVVEAADLVRLGGLLAGMDLPDAPLAPEILEACTAFLSQAMNGLCTGFAQSCGLPIHCSALEAVNPDGCRTETHLPGNLNALTFRIALENSADLQVLVLLQSDVLSSLNAQLPHYAVPANGGRTCAAPSGEQSRWNIDLILDVELEVAVSFGETEMPLRDVLKLGVGSVIELEKGVNDPVSILVNNKPIARGEVVMVDGNYGVKVLQVESTADRIRSLQKLSAQ